MAELEFNNDSFKTITILEEDSNIPPVFWSMIISNATRTGDYNPETPEKPEPDIPITPYEGLKFQTSLAAGLRPAGDFPLMRAKDVVMPDGTRLEDFKPTELPEVNNDNNGQVLMVKEGKWSLGETIRAEIDSENPTILNIF